MKYLACVAEKYTKKQLSPLFEIESNDSIYSVYAIVQQLEQLSGIAINGKTNYADIVEVDNE